MFGVNRSFFLTAIPKLTGTTALSHKELGLEVFFFLLMSKSGSYSYPISAPKFRITLCTSGILIRRRAVGLGSVGYEEVQFAIYTRFFWCRGYCVLKTIAGFNAEPNCGADGSI